MKRCALAALLLVVLAGGAAPAAGAVPATTAAFAPAQATVEEPVSPRDWLLEAARRQWESLGMDDMLSVMGEVYQETGEHLPPLNWETVSGVLRGEGLPIAAGDLLAALAQALFGAIVDNAGLLGRLVLLAVLLAVLHLLQSAFESRSVAATAYTVVYLTMAVFALMAFYDALQLAVGTVRNLVSFMHSILPLLVTLLAGVGAFVSAGLLSPLVVMLVNGVGLIAANLVLPLLFLGTVLDVADHLPGRMRVARLASFMRQAGMVVLALSFTSFLGVVAVQGIAGGVADGALLRTAKYTAGTFIPVLGGMFADAAELVFGSSLVLKNAVGLIGMVAVIMLAAFPLVKVLALIIIFRLAAALIQPIAEGPFVQALGVMGDGLVQIGLVTAAVVLMFFLAMTVVVGAGTAAVMLR